MVRPMSDTITISVKGELVDVPCRHVRGVSLVTTGQIVRTSRIFDDYWIERARIPSLPDLIADLRRECIASDLLVFTQRVPEHEPHYADLYHYDYDNCAVLELSSYEAWFNQQIPSATRRAVKASAKRGVVVRQAEYDDQYVAGIKSIFDETPFRAGRRYWHFGKSLESVRRENGTYQARSVYLGAYKGELIGYLKMVVDGETAAIMQILSKVAERDVRPNNALIAAAVQICCERGIRYLQYEKYDYGSKRGDSLTRFKQSCGFAKMNLPTYYVPLTLRGRLALWTGLHKGVADRVPERLAAPLREARSRLLARTMDRSAE